ncbi:23802_t:CDS:1, partial [Gigaspora margarita]
NWSHIVEGWVNTLNDEELNDDESTNSKQLEFKLGGHIIHLTDDLLAK